MTAMEITLSRTLEFDGKLYSRNVEYRTLRKGDVYLNGFEGTLVCTSTIDLDGENRPFWPILKPIEEKETHFVYTSLPALGTLNGIDIKLDYPKKGELCFMRERTVLRFTDAPFIYPIVME